MSYLRDQSSCITVLHFCGVAIKFEVKQITLTRPQEMLVISGLFADRQGAQSNIQPMPPQGMRPARTCVSAARACGFAAQVAYLLAALFHRPAVLGFG